MGNRVMFISRSEGEKMQFLDPFRHNLTKEAVLSLPKVKKNNCITWGGWIHAFIIWERPSLISPLIGSLFRYDAVND